MKQRIFRKCHKPSGQRALCKTCEAVLDLYKREEQRQESVRMLGWIKR